MSAIRLHIESIHPTLWTYTRGVHSLRANSRRAFRVGVSGDSSSRCMRTSKYIASLIDGLGLEDLTYCTREANIEHSATPFVHDFAMAAFA
ncbi:hypothetical protein bAD24_p01385 (plasmid) [Burkholderia sp. AD24]|nr:hypothetical protein bAD24_p01385 [Burkholderia sp. AD24]